MFLGKMSYEIEQITAPLAVNHSESAMRQVQPLPTLSRIDYEAEALAHCRMIHACTLLVGQKDLLSEEQLVWCCRARISFTNFLTFTSLLFIATFSISEYHARVSELVGAAAGALA